MSRIILNAVRWLNRKAFAAPSGCCGMLSLHRGTWQRRPAGLAAAIAQNFGVHYSLWVALNEVADVLQGLPVESAVGLLCHIAQMRGQQNIVQAQERMVRRQRLLVEGVESSTRYRARLEGADQSIFVDDGASLDELTI